MKRSYLKKLGGVILILIFLNILGCESQIDNQRPEQTHNTLSDNRTIPCGLVSGDCSFTFQTFRNNIPIVIGQCTVLVNYTLEVCFDANNVAKRIAISNMTWNWSAGCDSIRSSWSDLYAQGFYSALNTQMNSFYNSLSIAIENYETPNFEGFPCPESGDPCQAEQSSFEFYVSDCFKRCAYFDERESLYNIIEVKCGDACCRRITQFCYENGEIRRCPSRLVSNYGAYVCSGVVPDGLSNGTLFGNCLNPCEKVN